MKYKVTLNGKVYEVVVERGEAICTDEYDAPAVTAAAPAPAPAPAPVAAPAPAPAPTPAPVVPAPAAPVASGGGETVKAPLPGTVLKIKTPSGTAVKAGDIILILEAMKMENEITAPCSGTIGDVFVTEGKAVSNGDALLTIK